MILPARPFYFLRHGEADWNVEHRCIGQLDRPLTARGRAQAEQARDVCAALAISVIVHSPLSRAADTAAIVAAARWPLRAASGLMEGNLGVMQGMREDQPDKPFIREWIAGNDIPGAESYTALKYRVAVAVAEVLAASADALPPLLVAHAGVYHALRDIMGSPVGRVHHCVPYVHRPVDGGWAVEEMTSA